MSLFSRVREWWEKRQGAISVDEFRRRLREISPLMRYEGGAIYSGESELYVGNVGYFPSRNYIPQKSKKYVRGWVDGLEIASRWISPSGDVLNVDAPVDAPIPPQDITTYTLGELINLTVQELATQPPLEYATTPTKVDVPIDKTNKLSVGNRYKWMQK